MADAAGFDLDQDILRAGLRLLDVFHDERRFEIAKDGGFHRNFPGTLCPRDSGLAKKRWNFFALEAISKESPDTAHGLAPRKKNSTALCTRSVSLCGPVRSTAHCRTTVLKSPSMNSARCTTGKSRVISPFFWPWAMISRRRLTVAASAPRNSGERTGSMAPARMTACQSGGPTSVVLLRVS